MRTFITTQTVYTLAELKELDERAFDKACDKLRQFEPFEWDDQDYWTEELAKRYGIRPDWNSLRFEVGWGAEWADVEWDVENNEQFVRAMIAAHPHLKYTRHFILMEYAFEGISWASRRRDSNSMISDIRWDWRANSDSKAVKSLEEWIHDLKSTVEGEILSAISAEFEYRNSEEYLLEMAEANEWEFDSEGNLA